MATARGDDVGNTDLAKAFDALWETLVDVLGPAATATLLRRALKRATSGAPDLGSLVISREQFAYRYTLPPAWLDAAARAPIDPLCVLIGELRPLLVELTGNVVWRRLAGIPELRSCAVFDVENES